MAPLSLPLDVVDAVCAFVPTVDLLNVATASSLLHPLALRRIYRFVELTTPEQAVHCLRSLDKHPQLARYVRVFSLRLDSRKAVDECYASFRPLLRDVLSRMDGLVELELVVAPADGTLVFKGLDPLSPSYPRLSRFSTNLSLDSAMCSFLERTPALRDLQLGEQSPSIVHPVKPLSTSALPNLSIFMGSMASVVAIAPGRPLESVHLYSATPSSSSSPSEEEELSPEVLSALAQSSGPITVFGALTRSLSLETVRGLTESLPHLHHLRIMTMYHAQTAHHPDEVRSCCHSSLLKLELIIHSCL